MKKRPASGYSLKDQLFNRGKVRYLAGLFEKAGEPFDAEGFVRSATKGLKTLELKQRIVWIASVLEGYLDPDFRVAAEQIVRALPPPLDPTKTDDDFGDFIFAPLGEYVVRNGLERKHLRRSLRTLREITQRFSMEDAVRAFIREFPDPTLAELERWSRDRNYHVRRLVSEGTRPTLPWSGRLPIEVTLPLPLLDRLHADPTRYVTRSVANHLNDISKTRPDLVLARLRSWKSAKRQAPAELAWIGRHALRTLVKKGHAPALRFLGFRPNPKIEVREFTLDPSRVEPGQTVSFRVAIEAQRAESLVVDYVIDFVKANGSSAPKVFKARQVDVEKGAVVVIEKRHPLRANATTFTLYPGTHRLTLQVNGRAVASEEFELVR